MVKSKTQTSNFLVGVFFVIVSLVLIRLIGLSTSPPGFFVDESSIGYNAYSILKTAKDEHGFFLPVFFKAFGEYKNPLFIYSAVPFIWLFDLNIISVRLTAAAWGLLSSLVFFRLAWEVTKNKAVSFFAWLIILANPWHILLSRIGFEVISFPVFLILSYLFLHGFSQSKKEAYFNYFAFTLGLSFYSYTSAKFLSIAFFTWALILFGKQLRRKIIFPILIFCLTLVPALWWETHYPGSLRARYDVVSVFSYYQGWEANQQIFWQYLGHFNPVFLFFVGDGNWRHTLGFNGIISWATVPLILLGFRSLLKNLKQTENLWLIGLLFLSLIPSAVTVHAPHVLRSVSFIVDLLIVSLYGLKSIQNSKKCLWIFFLLLSLESFMMVRYMFNYYPEKAGIWFDEDVVKALTIAVQEQGPYLLSENLYPGTDATWLFVRKFEPFTNQNAGLIDTEFVSTSELTTKGTYVFDYHNCLNLPTSFLTQAQKKETNTYTCVFTL